MQTRQKSQEKIFTTAGRLFYQQGFRAVGVDTIAAEAGIGKMTLYRHFPSKDDLIVAYLEQSDRDFWHYFELSIQNSPDAQAQILAFFVSLQGYVTSPECYGCPFINLANEYPAIDYPGHQVALQHKQAVRQRFRQMASAAQARHPEKLANALMVLMDGAYIAARMYRGHPENPAADLAHAVSILLAQECPEINQPS